MSYVALATVTLTSTASTVTFSSIPATYKDLILVMVAKSGTGTRSALEVRPNNDSGNASRVFMFGDGSSTGSGTGSVLTIGTLPNSGEQFNQFHLEIFDYSATDKHKSMLAKQRWAGITTDATAMRWASTTAITSLVFVTGQNFIAGSTFSLYGVA